MTKLSDEDRATQGRVRGTLRRAAGERKRLSVFRSSKHIYAQVIDDDDGVDGRRPRPRSRRRRATA